MEDEQIVNLYWERSENALAKTADKYGRYCRYIAYNILRNNEDTAECVNDTYMRAWNAMPPHRPQQLSTFLGKITRNLSLNKLEKQNSAKRGGGQVSLALDELEECLPGSSRVESPIDSIAITEVINSFLANLPLETRKIFMRRYWYLSSIQEIAQDFALGESKVKMLLFRARKELQQLLEKEGIDL